jgi:hypothetical protein
MKNFFKNDFIWILLFGTLIGLNETWLGSFSMPYRSVILCSMTLIILTLARLKIRLAGTSVLIILVAIVFKINNLGFHSCSTNILLCGPTSLLLMGIGYDIFASLFISLNKVSSLRLFLSCCLSAILAFSLFAVLNTYILESWTQNRLAEYILVKSVITALASGGISILLYYLIKSKKHIAYQKLNSIALNSVLSSIILLIWIVGSIVKF